MNDECYLVLFYSIKYVELTNITGLSFLQFQTTWIDTTKPLRKIGLCQNA